MNKKKITSWFCRSSVLLLGITFSSHSYSQYIFHRWCKLIVENPETENRLTLAAKETDLRYYWAIDPESAEETPVISKETKDEALSKLYEYPFDDQMSILRADKDSKTNTCYCFLAAARVRERQSDCRNLSQSLYPETIRFDLIYYLEDHYQKTRKNISL